LLYLFISIVVVVVVVVFYLTLARVHQSSCIPCHYQFVIQLSSGHSYQAVYLFVYSK